MKFTNLKAERLEEFFKVISDCEGNVYLESSDMKLNLKSKLCQYLSFAKLCSTDSEEIKELTIKAENKEDISKLTKFMYDGGK